MIHPQKSLISIFAQTLPLVRLGIKSYSQPLRIVSLAGAEQGLQTVIRRQSEACSVDEKFASNVEKDQEEVECTETKDDINFRHAGLLLEVVEGRVFREFL